MQIESSSNPAFVYLKLSIIHDIQESFQQQDIDYAEFVTKAIVLAKGIYHKDIQLLECSHSDKSGILTVKVSIDSVEHEFKCIVADIIDHFAGLGVQPRIDANLPSAVCTGRYKDFQRTVQDAIK